MTQPAFTFDAPTVYALHQRELEAEAARLDDAKSRILTRLRAGPATNVELNAICFRYGARIFELKRAGYAIEKALVEKGVWVYTLRGRTTEAA